MRPGAASRGNELYAERVGISLGTHSPLHVAFGSDLIASHFYGGRHDRVDCEPVIFASVMSTYVNRCSIWDNGAGSLP